MPEIKNRFQKGVMNKDLDERLVPNGQYRDAMNVQIATSEGSEVGTVQNILGNTRVDNFSLGDFRCVGAVADEKNDVFYWFIASPAVDAIIEYHDNETVTPILVDTNKDVLKFDPSNIITGINIIDNLLFWTDNVNEPKKINIDTLKLNSHTDLSTHSDMFVNETSVGDVTEDHITVIRKRPQKAPTVTFSETAIQPIFIFPDMNFFEKIVGSEVYGAFLQTTNVTSPYEIGDRLFLSEVGAVGNLPQNYQTKVEIISSPTAVSGGYTYSFEILEIIVSSVTNVFADGITRDFNVIKEVDEKTIFEKEFIRFATRYKYTDGEYSAFSPFTQPVFLSGVFGFHPTKDPYNLGMENKIINVKLQDLIPTDIPDDVVQLDILFKKERSTTVYSIDSIKPNDPAPNYWNKNDYNQRTILTTDYGSGGTFGSTTTYHDNSFVYNHAGEYEITTENIYAALPENQMLRPWDNVPRKALAQEITANRVVYANYLQNYDFKDNNGNLVKPQINVGKEERSFYNSPPVSFDDGLGKKSIKSLRTYYLGVVYGDKYGRETPVFTSKDASIHIPYDLDDGPLFNNMADKSLRLTTRLIGEQPKWADYYKYFIKQTTGEYYNLTLDRVYKNEDDGSFWLSFPSSDRNKIQEGDYFTIKKQVDLEGIVPEENKIKIIDIKNEAPDSIKLEHVLLGSAGGLDGYGSITSQSLDDLFPDVDARPKPGQKTLQVDTYQWLEARGPDLIESLTPSDKISVQFKIVRGGVIIKSKKYLVAAYSFNEDASSTNSTANSIGEYTIVLKDEILQKDSWIETSPGVMNDAEKLVMSIFRIQEKNAVEFSGRFFVKTISNAITQRYLVGSISDLYNYEVLAQMDMFNLADAPGTTYANGGVEGIYNTQQTTWVQTSPYNLTDTELEWDVLTTFNTGGGSSRGWFLDSTGYVALAGANHVDAYNSGVMTYSQPFSGPSGDPEVVNGFEGVVDYNVGDLYRTVTSYNQFGQQNIHPHPDAIRVILGSVRHLHSDLSGLESAAPIGNWAGTSWLYKPSNYPSPSNTPFFLHWSYACPGVDLHDGDFKDLETAIDTWGSGGYTQTVDFLNDFFVFGLQKIKATQIMVSAAPGQTLPSTGTTGAWQFHTPTVTSYNNLIGQDLDDANSCFDPGYNSAAEQAIINNMEEVGARFMIDGDHSNEYSILSVKKRNVYNHTPWNIIAPHDATSSAAQTVSALNENVSVTKKLQNFFNYLGTNGSFTIDTSVTTGYRASAEYAELKEAIVNFGKANNRRRVYILELDKDPRISWALPSSLLTTDPTVPQTIRFIDDFIDTDKNNLPISPAVFETEAKEDVDLNIYYEASDALPVKLDEDPESLKGYLLGPVGSKVTCSADFTPLDIQNTEFPGNDFHPRVVGWEGNIVEVNNPGLRNWGAPPTISEQNIDFENKTITFWREDLSYTTAKIDSVEEITGNYITKLKIKQQVHNKTVGLPYYNCFSFGNGVESNRIRDDYNESFILNGVKASTVLEEPYEEERRKYGLIYSGLYNSTSGVNNLNQFIQAEKITKDLMPSYGSIQKLYARNKDLVTLCEDKIIRVYVDKDILYNADGNSQLLATDKVLGTAEPFRGNYGISKNPESFASESFRAYFTDKQRGAVLRLSMDGLTPISDAGMHDYFRDNLKDGGRLHGSYDAHKEDYNLSIYFGDGEDNVLNPEFNEGFTHVFGASGSELLFNPSFTNVTTLFDTTTKIDDGMFQSSANYSSKWIASNPGSMQWDAANALQNIGRTNIDGVINSSASYSNPNYVASIGTGSVRWHGQISPGYYLIQDIHSPTTTAGDQVKINWDFFDMVSNGAYSGGNKIRITFLNKNGDGFEIGYNDIKFNQTPPNVTETHYEFTKTVVAGFDPGGHTPPSVGYWRVKMELMPTAGTPWVSKEFKLDNFEVFVSTTTTDDWTINALVANSNGTLIFQDGGIATQTQQNYLFDSHKTYRVECLLSSPFTIGTTSQNARIDLNGQPINAVNTGSQGGVGTFQQNGVMTNDINFNISTSDIEISVTGGAINIQSISIKEIVPFGGSVDYWNLNGGSNQANIYTAQDAFSLNKKIVFDEAPQDTYLHQDLINTNRILDFTSGTKCNVSFNVYNYTGSGELTFMLYNDEGEGFEYPITANGSYSFSGIIGNDNSSTLTSVFGFYVSSTNTFSGEIDNVSLIIDGEGAGKTISFNEQSKGWSSFKSFVPEFGISCVNQYYTMNLGQLWKHHVEQFRDGEEINRNTFYDVFEESSITPVLNTNPDVIKNFNTLNYEGSQTKVDIHLTDNDYYNLHEKKGWYVEEIHTDKQDGALNEFIEKEGKWFNYIKGKPGKVDTAAFNFQGLGIAEEIFSPVYGCVDPNAVNYDPTATIDDGSCAYAWSFEMQLRSPTSSYGTDGAARIVYTSTNIEATGYTYAWSSGTYTHLSTTSEITGLTLGPITCTLIDGVGGTHSMSDFLIVGIVNGCTNPNATNFNYSANTDDGTCTI